MDNLVRNYTDVLTPEKCQYFIDKFEAHPDMQEEQNNRGGATLTQINLLQSPDTPFKEDANFLINVLMGSVESYKKDVLIDSSLQWPEKNGIEPPKMKRYLPDTSDEFPDHVDVLDYKTARRFLVMFIYLSDNERGATVIQPRSRYKDYRITSPCEKGSIVLFPPMWPWLHAGQRPVNESKYIIGSYLHYV